MGYWRLFSIIKNTIMFVQKFGRFLGGRFILHFWHDFRLIIFSDGFLIFYILKDKFKIFIYQVLQFLARDSILSRIVIANLTPFHLLVREFSSFVTPDEELFIIWWEKQNQILNFHQKPHIQSFLPWYKTSQNKNIVTIWAKICILHDEKKIQRGI